MEGICKQLGENDEQMVAIGLNRQFVAHMAVQVKCRGMVHQSGGILESFACQLVAVHVVVSGNGLLTLYQRGGKQFAYHIVKVVGLHIHCLGYLMLLVAGNHLVAVAQHL